MDIIPDMDDEEIESIMKEGLEIALDLTKDQLNLSDEQKEGFRDVFDLIFNHSKGVSDENINLGKEFLECSKKDIVACKLLYKKGQFSTSTYHLQQAVEKIAKSFGLYHGFINIKDLKPIGHDTLKSINYMVKNPLISSAIPIIKDNFHPGLKDDLTNLENLWKNKEKRIAIANASYEEIMTIINLTRQIKDNIYANEMPKYDDLKEITNDFYYLDFTFDFLPLVMLFAYTFPHEEFTRYPKLEKESENLTPFDYSKKLGIVKATPEIIEILEDMSSRIEDLYIN